MVKRIGIAHILKDLTETNDSQNTIASYMISCCEFLC